MKRAIIYVDGFNLYFSLKENNWRKYYWLDIEKLVTPFLRPGHVLHKIKYFTSVIQTPLNKQQRQQQYLSVIGALDNTEIIYGRFQCYKKKCISCGELVNNMKEKKTDVNIATHMLFDGMRNECEALYLITGDSDISPAVEFIRKLPDKPYVYLICPPKPLESKKYRVSTELIKTVGDHKFITQNMLKSSLFDDPFITKFGKMIFNPWSVTSPAHAAAQAVI